MSLTARQPKCSRCRHHGIIVPQKGHTKYCPFLTCDCWKCYLITQRTRLTALQRSLKKAQPQKKEQRPCVHTGKPAASARSGGTRPSATRGTISPPSRGAPERAAANDLSPLGLRSRPAGGGEDVSSLDSGKVLLPLSPSYESRRPTHYNPPDFGEFGQTAPLPVIHFPFWMSGHYPSSFLPCPNFLLNMPGLPPVPAGFYNNGLCGPLMLPYCPLGAVHYPPPPQPGPPSDCRQVFFTLQPPPLPEPFYEEMTSMQHLQTHPSNIEELD